MGEITQLAMPDNNLIQQFAAQPLQIGAAFDQALQASRQQQLDRYQLGVALSQAHAKQTAQQAYIAHPTAENFNAYVATAPEVAEKIKSGFDALTTDQQNTTLRGWGDMYAAVRGGNIEAAKTLAQQRIDADRAAGHDTTNDEAGLAILNSGDPTKALAFLGAHIGAAKPDKFAELTKDLGAEDRANAEEPGKIALTSAQTDQANAAARKDQFLTVGNAEGGQDVLNIGGPTGGAPAAPAAASTPGGAPSTPSTIPGPAGQAVAEAAAKVGATPEDIDYLGRTAALESHGQPGAQNGSSTGVFQMQPKTFAGLGGKDINDVGQQTLATLKNARQNAKQMRGMIGRQPTAAEVYLAHQQGATGASGLIGADPNTNAIKALIGVGVSPAKAKASIIGNGGTEDMTAGQFVQKWGDAYAKAAGGGGEATGSVAGDDQPQLGPGVSVAYKAAGSSENRLTPEAVDYVAQQYIATGQLPPLGMGKAATANRNAVLNRAQQIEAETGATGYDAVARHATMKTAQATLTQASKTLSAVQAAEGTVSDNMNIVMRLAPKGGGPTGSPILNAPIQSLRKNVWGSKDVAAFDGALGTVADEYGKVMTTSTGTGGQALSDSARQEAYSRLSKAATIGQLQQTMSTMRQEMANRSAELSKQRAEQLAILSNRGAAPQAAPAPPPPPAPAAAPAPPKVGTVQDGYRYKGGNPADPKSWAKV